MAHNLHDWFRQDVEKKAAEIVGGLDRLKVLILMACVLGLDSADKATVGAVALQLKHSLNIGNVDIGLLVTASTGISAVATIPIGIMADRFNRTYLLTASIVLWSITMAISGAANSFVMLLLTRLALGAVLATATPVISSLTGDYFRPGIRGQIWGYILSGELFGAGFGILISGEIAALWSWRISFWMLSIVSLALAAAVGWWLPEPERGGQSRLRPLKGNDSSQIDMQKNGESSSLNKNRRKENMVEQEVEKEHIPPDESLILQNNPADMPFWRAVRYILSIRTNVYLIIASACGYFFFTGLRTFAVVFLSNRFNLSQGNSIFIVVLIGLGAILGVFTTGHVADQLIESGHIRARIVVGAAAFLTTAALFLTGFSMASLWIAGPFLFLASAALGGTNPPLNAARLDIMHSRLWGRAESVRTTLRSSFEAVAPLVFGWISTLFGGGQSGTFGQGGQGGITNSSVIALTHTFEVMLIPVVIAAIVLHWAWKTYAQDVSTALASEEATK
ncbi:MAG TPA: MFS transporter [Balneolaceae bacterium]|nr:MFS transporter [Balneolaceae bacterium]